MISINDDRVRVHTSNFYTSTNIAFRESLNLWTVLPLVVLGMRSTISFIMNSAILLEIQYWAPIQYFSKSLLYPNIYIEQKEHYVKRSFRNRSHIITANGVLCLSIPLVKGKHQQKDIRDVQIDYSENWQQVHWRSIRTAYGRAPFFDYYAESLVQFYEKKYDLLFDFNINLQNFILNTLGLPAQVAFTDTYQKEEELEAVLDFRNKINPKTAPSAAEWDSQFQVAYYPQVFEDRHGFIPNLSILDLLFCTGPEATLYLQQSIR